MQTQLIYLVRHGETDANLQNIYQEQVYKLAECLKNEAGKVNAIYASPLERALETAAILAHVLSNEHSNLKNIRVDDEGVTLPQIIIERGLAEIDHGDWDGKTVDEVKAIWPKILETWQNGNQNLVKFPNGDSVRSARKRVKSAFDNILNKNNEEKIIIVSHGGTNALILSHLLKTTYFRPIRQSNACLNIIERKIENNKNEFRILLMNSTAHLL